MKISDRLLKRGLFLPLFTVMFSLFVSNSFAQSETVSINVTDVTLEQVLNTIEEQTNYLFVYDKSVDVTSKVTANFENTPVKSVLKEIFINNGASYIMEGTSIIISADKAVKVAPRSGAISGMVVDMYRNPVVGATVIVKDTNTGATTNINGEFDLNLATITPTTTLIVDFLGYEPYEVLVGSGTYFNIIMKESSVKVDEVVVTALGIKRAEKALSYNVQEVNSDEIVGVKDVNFINSLSGKVAGVNINTSSSGVGGASKVVMRGTKSITQSSNALYVIDGVPMFNSSKSMGTEHGSAGSTEAIADINPEDIESMSVLTGAAAAALYGSDASNGAIIITTKKGKAGQTSITVSSNTEILSPFVTPEFQNRYGTGVVGSTAENGNKSWGYLLPDYAKMGYNPMDDYLKMGFTATESVSLSTGTDRNQTYLSAGMVNSEGVIPNNSYDRYNFTFRNTTNFFDDKMTLDVGASYINQHDVNMINQGTYGNPLVTSYLFPRGDDWNDIKMFERWDVERNMMLQYWPQSFGELTGQNPYWINYRNLRENSRDRYMMNANLSYQVLDWLSVSGRIRIDNTVSKSEEKLFASSNSTLIEGSKNGLYGLSNIKDKQAYGDAMVSINKMWDDFSINANVGASFTDNRSEFTETRGPIDNTYGVANVFYVMHLDKNKTKSSQGGFHDQTQSVFASAEVGYKGAYYLTVTARNDWPSQLAGPLSSTSSFFYPSVGASVIFSEIFDMPEQLSYLKLRGSYASVGLPFNRFLAIETWKWEDNDWANSTHFDIKDLQPERTKSFEVGITARFLKRFNLDVSYYLTHSTNQTFDVELSATSTSENMFIQTGNIQNQGIELALGYSNSWDQFTWNSNFTFSTNQNKILEMVDNYWIEAEQRFVNINERNMNGLGQADFVIKKGGSLGDLYSSVDLARDSNGNIYVNENGQVMTVALADEDRIKLGSVLPKANLSWRNDFTYGNFNFGFLVSARIGGIVYSATQAAMDFYGVSEASAVARDNGGVMINGGDIIDPYIWYSAIGGQNTGIPQHYTYSATNVRLQEASIGYTIPRNKLGGVTDITISLVGRNLWMIYNKAPFDPEAVASMNNYYQGIDNFMIPGTRNIGFNVRLKF